jgi:multisubunit Na+/H+ antiporter MnhB subunit
VASPDPSREDPCVRAARREAIVVSVSALCALAWTVVSYSLMGFKAQGDQELRFVDLGGGVAFPDWVFWGIVIPWGICFVLGSIFALFFIQDTDLGEELEEQEEFLASEVSSEPGESGGGKAC